MEIKAAAGLLVGCAGLALLVVVCCSVLVWVKARPHADCRAEIAALKTEMDELDERSTKAARRYAGRVRQGTEEVDGPGPVPVAESDTPAARRGRLLERLQGRKTG